MSDRRESFVLSAGAPKRGAGKASFGRMWIAERARLRRGFLVLVALAAAAADAEVLHFGSIASWTPPGSKRIDQLVSEARARNGVLVSYDPNPLGFF